MKLVNASNQGIVEVSEELALRLLEGGGYIEFAKPAPAKKTAKKAPAKTEAEED